MITGKTTLIAHLGFPTTTFKSPMIYNPYFEDAATTRAPPRPAAGLARIPPSGMNLGPFGFIRNNFSNIVSRETGRSLETMTGSRSSRRVGFTAGPAREAGISR